MKRIGIFGGSFDPVHNAHVALAHVALNQLGLDEIRWVPVWQAWQKTRRLAPAADREAMVRLAIAGEPRFVLERSELRRRGNSFTLDTVRELRAAEPDVETAFAMTRAVGDALLPAYLPIVQRRNGLPYGEAQRAFQAYRRGRYVEFNLVWDRGTHFGLQSGGRTESILMSMPPLAAWRYDWKPQAGSAEARLYSDFLRPRDWASEDAK